MIIGVRKHKLEYLEAHHYNLRCGQKYVTPNNPFLLYWVSPPVVAQNKLQSE